MQNSRLEFIFMNIGHFLDHYFVLIFATAVLRLSSEWGMSYAELIPYGTLGFIAFGIGAIPAGWLADKWSREGMMAVFFIGIGVSSILVGWVNTPFELAVCLTLVGMFASIYHPVGLAIVVQSLKNTGIRLAFNGIFGNLGVASAALLTGVIVDFSGWRSAFVIPGLISIAVGLTYLHFIRVSRNKTVTGSTAIIEEKQSSVFPKQMLIRIFSIILFTTAVGGLVFQSTTFSLPKVLDEQLPELSGNTTLIGSYAFLVFSLAAMAQLVVGYLIDRYPARNVLAIVAILQAIFFIAMTQLHGHGALLVAIAFMLVVFGQIPINDFLIGRLAHSRWRSRAYALRYLVTFSVMASALPLIAWLHHTWGFFMLFGVLAVAGFMIFLAALLLPVKLEFRNTSSVV